MKIRKNGAKLLSLVAFAALAAGCSHGSKGANVPEGSQVSAPTNGGPGVVTSPKGEQYAVTDVPTSGEASNRPKMSSSAASAHAAGLQAFQSGDLEGARTQFAKASDADPNAYQAAYSLGVVR